MPVRVTPSQGTTTHYGSFTNAIFRIDTILFLCCIGSLFWGFIHFTQKCDTFHNPLTVYDLNGPMRGISWYNTVSDFHAHVTFFFLWCFPPLLFTFLVSASLSAWSTWSLKFFYRILISVAMTATQMAIVIVQLTGDPSIKWRYAYISQIPEWLAERARLGGFEEHTHVDMWQNVNTNLSKFMMIASGIICLAAMTGRLLLDARIILDRFSTRKIHLPYHNTSNINLDEKPNTKGKGRPTSSHSFTAFTDPLEVDSTTEANTSRNRNMFATGRPSISSVRSYFRRSPASRRASASMPASARQSTDTELRSVWSMVRASSPRPSLFTLLNFPLDSNASRQTLPAYSAMSPGVGEKITEQEAANMPDAENVNLITYDEASDAGDIGTSNDAQASTSASTSTEVSLHMSDRYSTADMDEIRARGDDVQVGGTVGNVGVSGQSSAIEEMMARCMREQEQRFTRMLEEQAQRYEALMAKKQ